MFSSLLLKRVLLVRENRLMQLSRLPCAFACLAMGSLQGFRYLRFDNSAFTGFCLMLASAMLFIVLNIVVVILSSIVATSADDALMASDAYVTLPRACWGRYEIVALLLFILALIY